GSGGGRWRGRAGASWKNRCPGRRTGAAIGSSRARSSSGRAARIACTTACATRARGSSGDVRGSRHERGTARPGPPRARARPLVGSARPFVPSGVAERTGPRFRGAMSTPSRAPLRRLSGAFLSLVVAPVLWAIPFALFFGTLYGEGLRGYGSAYVVSVVFAVVIRGAIALAQRLAMPAIRRRGRAG